jgi:acetyl esterase/lipase
VSDERDVLERGGRTPDAVLQYGNDADQCIDLLHGDAPHTPLVVLLHGGYWRPEWDRAHMRPMADALASLGCTVANVEYRRIPGDPDATLHDIAKALNALIEQHPDIELVIVGFSAGGHLALLLAAQEQFAQDIDRVVALAPVADLAEVERRNLDDGAALAFLGVPASGRIDLDPMHCDPRMPVHLLHSPDDDLVPFVMTEQYANRHGLSVTPTTGGHFGLIDPQHETWALVRTRILNEPATGTIPS